MHQDEQKRLAAGLQNLLPVITRVATHLTLFCSRKELRMKKPISLIITIAIVFASTPYWQSNK